jgi:hypothetical protein
MPPNFHVGGADLLHSLAVELERFDGCPANRGLPNNCQAIG